MTGFLMDGARYTDTGCPGGCDASLACPLPQCVYDAPGWHARHVRAKRDARIVMRKKQGVRRLKIAAEFGVAERTVDRVLRKERTKP